MRISDWSSDVCSSDLFTNHADGSWSTVSGHNRDVGCCDGGAFVKIEAGGFLADVGKFAVNTQNIAAHFNKRHLGFGQTEDRSLPGFRRHAGLLPSGHAAGQVGITGGKHVIAALLGAAQVPT